MIKLIVKLAAALATLTAVVVTFAGPASAVNANGGSTGSSPRCAHSVQTAHGGAVLERNYQCRGWIGGRAGAHAVRSARWRAP